MTDRLDNTAVTEALAAEALEVSSDVWQSRKEKADVSFVVILNDNEADVDELVRGLRDLVNNLDTRAEVVFVDDGSRDGTFEKLSRALTDFELARAVRLRSRSGEAAALDAGLSQSSGDVVVYFTARVRPNPAQLAALVAKIAEGYDLVIGWRHPRRDSRLNQIISKMFNRMVAWLTGLKLHDINSGVFAARREVLEAIPFYGDLNNFIAVMADRLGYKIAEVQIEQLPGRFRQSRYVREYLQRLLDIVTVIFLTRYSKKPLHFLGFLGAVFTLVGGVISAYLFFYRLFGFGGIAGRPLMLLGALLLVIGIQMISIGLLGEMIIFTHARDIREYSIEKVIGN
ncbi:MAG: glycosyltransferase [Calditrichaeota bacterium]|nr:glycosyltransferase [Calditrichota bacterium]